MRRAALILGLAAAGCRDPAAPLVVSALTYNVQGGGPRIAAELAALRPSFASLQECVGCEVPAGYARVGNLETEVDIVYRADDWSLVDTGALVLGEDDDGWGRREARWAELSSTSTADSVTVYSTHWCVPIRTSTDPCDTARQLEYAAALLDDIATRTTPVILGGDFNVFDGFERGPVVGRLLGSGLVDTQRASGGLTFDGNTWAPPGRIDYLFATRSVGVGLAWVQSDSASDHRPVSAVLRF